MLTKTEVEAIKPVRYARKVWDGRGLYLLVTPKGARCWRYAYRFAGKYKKLSLGTYPMITIASARSRHEFARNLLTRGVDPAALKAALGKAAFAAMTREWEIARGHVATFDDTILILGGCESDTDGLRYAAVVIAGTTGMSAADAVISCSAEFLYHQRDFTLGS